MKVRKSVLNKLNTNRGHGLIMLTLGCALNTAKNMVKTNQVDGDLTKTSMVKAIEQEYGLTQEEILFDEKDPKDAEVESQIKETSN